MPSNVRVAVRVRPLIGQELEKGHKTNLMEVDSERNEISIYQQDSSTKKSYSFDKILNDNYS